MKNVSLVYNVTLQTIEFQFPLTLGRKGMSFHVPPPSIYVTADFRFFKFRQLKIYIPKSEGRDTLILLNKKTLETKNSHFVSFSRRELSTGKKF